MIPVPNRAIKNARSEHFKNTVQRIQHQDFHNKSVNAALVQSFEAVHDRCNVEKHKRYNAVNVLNILKINVKNRKYKTDARAENAKENYRHERKKNVP